jgi:hypothetical protein
MGRTTPWQSRPRFRNNFRVSGCDSDENLSGSARLSAALFPIALVELRGRCGSEPQGKMQVIVVGRTRRLPHEALSFLYEIF